MIFDANGNLQINTSVGSVFNATPPALSNGALAQQQVDSVGSLCVNNEGRRNTYRGVSVAFTPVAAVSYPLWTISGSSTKTVRITRLHIAAFCTTGTALPARATLYKFSSNSGGTQVAGTASLMDSNNAAATAVFGNYTTIPTTAAVIGGPIQADVLSWITQSATVPQPPTAIVDWTFGTNGGQQLVLRGASQWAGFYLSAIGTTPVMSVTCEWVEDNS
jgi:hypothetical protein